MTAPDDVRARFEAGVSRYMGNGRASLARSEESGIYLVPAVESMWLGYRAAHADLSGEVRELVEKGQALAAIVRKQCGGYTSGPGFDALNAAIELDAALAKFTHQEKP